MVRNSEGQKVRKWLTDFTNVSKDVHYDEGTCQPGTARKGLEHSKGEGTDSVQPNGANLRFMR